MSVTDQVENTEETPFPDSHPRFDIELQIAALPHPIHWPDIFGNDKPVHFEMGSGSGHWTAQFALRHPEINLIAVEKVAREVRRAKHKAQRRELANVRFVRCDALYFIGQFVADASIDALHIYFPDPWPKNRHARRRVIQSESVNELTRILKSGGVLHIKTDVTPYQDQIVEALGASEPLALVESCRLDLEDAMSVMSKPALSAAPTWSEIFHLTSNYERKANESGHPVYYTRWNRAAD